jgi:hypothetical protein
MKKSLIFNRKELKTPLHQEKVKIANDIINVDLVEPKSPL